MPRYRGGMRMVIHSQALDHEAVDVARTTTPASARFDAAPSRPALSRCRVRRFVGAFMFASTILSIGYAPARAGSLEITPVLVDVTSENAAASMITLRNRSAQPATVQLRLLRWRQRAGTDRLDRSDEVAVSPPFATLAAGGSYVVRVVRTATRPIIGEEAYRLFVDELPPPAASAGTIVLAIRYSLPVFFKTRTAAAPTIAWTATASADGIVLAGENAGGQRLRIAGLRLVDAAGRPLSFGPGLAGYLLGHGGRSWSVRPSLMPFALAGAHVEYDTDAGPRREPLRVSAASRDPNFAGPASDQSD